jgi:hypothetical protein
LSFVPTVGVAKSFYMNEFFLCLFWRRKRSCQLQ